MSGINFYKMREYFYDKEYNFYHLLGKKDDGEFNIEKITREEYKRQTGETDHIIEKLRNSAWAYQFNDRCSNDFWLVPFWWERLLEDPDFVNQLKERWNDLRGSSFSEVLIVDKIDAYISTLNNAGAIISNFTEWSILSEWIWPNNFVGTTYQEESDYLKCWLTDRLSWLDTNISAL